MLQIWLKLLRLTKGETVPTEEGVTSIAVIPAVQLQSEALCCDAQ